MRKVESLNKLRVGKRIFYLVGEEEKFLYNDIKIQLEKKYHISITNRDSIIKVLLSHLTQGDFKNSSFPNLGISVLRTDLKNFFPSVNKHRLYKKVIKANVLSHDAMKVIKNICFNKKNKGIPLGLPFSNHLAEIYIEDLDNELQRFFSPIAYFRYVDDILILTYDFSQNEKERKAVASKNQEIISTLANKFSLEINIGKTISSFYKFDKSRMNLNKDLHFIYLGYEFKTINQRLHISIAPDKIKKYSNKVNELFYSYKKGKRREIDFWRLYYRLINILHGVTTIDRNNKKLKLGMGYHYRFTNDYSNLETFKQQCIKLIYSLKLRSRYRYLLLNIIGNNDQQIFLNFRYNYLNLTDKQMKIISERLSIKNPPKEKNAFIRKMFTLLYHS